MALARIAKSGLRRSVGATGSFFRQEDIYNNKCFLPSPENVSQNGNFSYLSGFRTVTSMTSWSRGIRTTPDHQYRNAERILEDSESEYEDPRYPGLEATKPGEKPRVVVLGTGWGACRFLKGLDSKIYDVVCISPRNHMVFTPLLASTCVGTLEFRSVAEPVSRIQTSLASDPNSYFYLASCIGVDTDKHEVSELSKFSMQLA